MSKRRRPEPTPPARRARWDRKQAFIALVAILIVLTLILSSLVSLLYQT